MVFPNTMIFPGKEPVMTPLRQRYLEDMQVRHLSPKTQHLDVECVSLYARHFRQSPERLGPEDIRAYPLYLVHDKQVSWSRFNQRVCALRFRSRVTLGKDWAITPIPLPRKETTLPVVLSPSDVAQLLGALTNLKDRTVLMTAYAAGLRVSEVLHLRVSDIDSPRMVMRIRQGKDHKDRSVMLSPTLLTLLREAWKAVRPTDWRFPGRTPDRPIGAHTLQEVCLRARRDSGLGQTVTTHTLRHSRSLRTTARYTQLSATTVAATVGPVDSLPRPPQPCGGLLATPPLEVADICRQYGPAYRDTHDASLSPQQPRAMRAIARCRTAARGGHVEPCDHGGHQASSYNSWRHRHGPTCQSLAPAPWLEERRGALLPLEYGHGGFTLPDSLAPLALQNQRVVYTRLFQAASQTLLRIAADPKHLGARSGLLAILHPWGQTLLHHPHRHGVVPGGGCSPDGQPWSAGRPGCLLPGRVLSRLFRRLCLEGLQQLFEQGRVQFHGPLPPVAHPPAFAHLLARCRRREWVV
jgi:integrase